MVIETRTQNALDRFVHKTRELFASEPDLDKRWEALTPILAELLADPTVIEASENWPDCEAREGRGENLIFYEDPDFGFAINGLTKGQSRQGRLSRVHDHGEIYTLYGVLSGHERIERYDRLDDRSRPDYAKIELASNTYCGPGEIDLVGPYEIHRENTVGERTVAVIIRSKKAGNHLQGRYDAETGVYFEGYGPRQTPVEMFASPG